MDDVCHHLESWAESVFLGFQRRACEEVRLQGVCNVLRMETGGWIVWKLGEDLRIQLAVVDGCLTDGGGRLGHRACILQQQIQAVPILQHSAVVGILPVQSALPVELADLVVSKEMRPESAMVEAGDVMELTRIFIHPSHAAVAQRSHLFQKCERMQRDEGAIHFGLALDMFNQLVHKGAVTGPVGCHDDNQQLWEIQDLSERSKDDIVRIMLMEDVDEVSFYKCLFKGQSPPQLNRIERPAGHGHQISLQLERG
mmetsp:Transcript_35680/g.64432  ORF Transcript_35680/g.64432 Transcript_35680/m.64432 type:complete len:255 (+) Transcript_35680:345-1109(+)